MKNMQRMLLAFLLLMAIVSILMVTRKYRAAAVEVTRETPVALSQSTSVPQGQWLSLKCKWTHHRA